MSLQDIRDQATAAWQEAWWARIPHTQLASSRDGCLKWYW